MIECDSHVFDELAEWLRHASRVRSAVVFGSSHTWPEKTKKQNYNYRELDLHLIVSKASLFERIEWNKVIPSDRFCFQASRPATGAVRKVTVIFQSAQFDMVLVPLAAMRIAAIGLKCGLYEKAQILRKSLDEMSTCLRSGYQFLKGNRRWRVFYSRVSQLPGVRLDDQTLNNLADAAVCDTLWAFQKIESGELIAAQHLIHSRLSDTNLRLWRELRLRRNLSLPSFGLGRKMEELATESEKSILSLSANLTSRELCAAAWKSFNALRSLMAELVPTWQVPSLMNGRLSHFVAYSA